MRLFCDRVQNFAVHVHSLCETSAIGFNSFRGSLLTSASPGVSKLILSPFCRTGWSSLKKGPRIALWVATSVASAAFTYVISSTSLRRSMRQRSRSKTHPTWYRENNTHDSNPSTSQSNCPSLRLSVLICPAQFTSETPAAHSSTVRSISRAKSWR